MPTARFSMKTTDFTAAAPALDWDATGPILPYGRQWVDEEDVQAVANVLESDWLTTGPAVESFEKALASFAGAKHGIAVSNGTAALHTAMFALGIGTGDEVIVPPMTFAASANAAVYLGGVPVFADVVPDTLLLDPVEAEKKITARTKAIVAVDYAGQPCDYEALRALAERHGIALLSDGCHALGATYRGQPVGSLADLTTFSFHPVKHITTGEGGMITTDDDALAARMRTFRNHGITTDQRERAERGSSFYEMVPEPACGGRRRGLVVYAGLLADGGSLVSSQIERGWSAAWRCGRVVVVGCQRSRRVASEVLSALAFQ